MNTRPSVSIHIVAWNSMQFLPDLLNCLSEQIFRDFNVLIIDNGSTDGVEAFIREKYPNITVLRNARNLGFAGAHNQGIRYALEHLEPTQLDSSFVLVLNPDILLSQTFLGTLIGTAMQNSNANVGAFGAKLRRAFGENVHDEMLQETIKSDLLDSTGLRMYKNRTCADRGAGEMDQGQYDNKKEIFGVSGALALYRASALQDVRFEDEFFDEDFFAYKEDVDLAWRMQKLGWDAMFVPEALAFHYRGMYGKEKAGFFERLNNRRGKSRLRSYYSNRNQWLMLAKNLSISDVLISGYRVLPQELGRFLYTLLFETKNTPAFLDVIKFLPRMLKKRAWIKKNQKRSAKELRKWFV